MHLSLTLKIPPFCFFLNLPLTDQKGRAGGSIFTLFINCTSEPSHPWQTSAWPRPPIKGLLSLVINGSPGPGPEPGGNAAADRPRQRCHESETSRLKHRLSVSSQQHAFCKWRAPSMSSERHSQPTFSVEPPDPFQEIFIIESQTVLQKTSSTLRAHGAMDHEHDLSASFGNLPQGTFLIPGSGSHGRNLQWSSPAQDQEQHDFSEIQRDFKQYL